MKQLEPELTADEVEQVSPVFRAFKEAFGTSDTEQILTSGAHDRERPRLTDYFVDCLVVAVAYNCFTQFHDQHGFNRPTSEYLEWIKSNNGSLFTISEYENAKGSGVMQYKRKFKSLGLV